MTTDWKRRSRSLKKERKVQKVKKQREIKHLSSCELDPKEFCDLCGCCCMRP